MDQDWTFFHPVLSTQTKHSLKYFNCLLSELRITGLSCNRKLVPKAHARVQFFYDLVRSHAYFPERTIRTIQDGKKSTPIRFDGYYPECKLAYSAPCASLPRIRLTAQNFSNLTRLISLNLTTDN